MTDLLHFAFKDPGSTIVTLIVLYLVCQTVVSLADAFTGGDK